MEGLYSFVFQKYTFFRKKEKATYYKWIQKNIQNTMMFEK